MVHILTARCQSAWNHFKVESEVPIGGTPLDNDNFHGINFPTYKSYFEFLKSTTLKILNFENFKSFKILKKFQVHNFGEFKGRNVNLWRHHYFYVKRYPLLLSTVRPCWVNDDVEKWPRCRVALASSIGPPPLDWGSRIDHKAENWIYCVFY